MVPTLPEDHTKSVVTDSHVGRSVSLTRAAELMGVSRRSIYNYIEEGKLQTIRTKLGSQRVLVDSMNVIDGACVDSVGEKWQQHLFYKGREYCFRCGKRLSRKGRQARDQRRRRKELANQSVIVTGGS